MCRCIVRERDKHVKNMNMRWKKLLKLNNFRLKLSVYVHNKHFLHVLEQGEVISSPFLLRISPKTENIGRI